MPPELIALYTTMAYSQHTGKAPAEDSDIAEWLRTHDPSAYPVSIYNQDAHDYIIGLIDEAHADHGVDRIAVARSFGVLLGLHASGMTSEDSQASAGRFFQQCMQEAVSA